MTDSRWLDEWLRAWQSFQGAASDHPTNPWTAYLDHFTKSRPAASRQPFAGAMDKLTEQSRAFFELGQQIANHDRGDWRGSIFRYLDTLAEQAADPAAAARAVADASPLAYWRRFAGHDDSTSGDRPSFLAEVEKTLRTPGLGCTREYQASVQELSRRWLDYEKAYGEYAAYCAETGRRAVERLRGRLEEAFEAERGPDSVRALYDAWVACNEEVHAERAATREYAHLHGRMVNTLMAYKQQAGRLVDQWADAMGLPSRQEVDALHRKLKDTRQELRAVRARLGDNDDGR